MKPRTLFALLSLVSLLAACAVNAPITVWDFKSDCVFSVGHGGMRDQDDACGGDSQRICQDYETMLSEKFASRAQCMAQCRALHDQQYPVHLVDGCRSNVERAYSLCGQFCLRNYPQ